MAAACCSTTCPKKATCKTHVSVNFESVDVRGLAIPDADVARLSSMQEWYRTGAGAAAYAAELPPWLTPAVHTVAHWLEMAGKTMLLGNVQLVGGDLEAASGGPEGVGEGDGQVGGTGGGR